MNDKRVLSREEMTELIVERSGDVTKVGPVMRYIDAVLRLQNDMSRPVYIFDVDPNISEKEIRYIDDVMRSLGVACCIVPRGMLGYVGEATSESFGVRNIKQDVFNLREGVVIPVGQDDGSWNDGGGIQGDERERVGVAGVQGGGGEDDGVGSPDD